MKKIITLDLRKIARSQAKSARVGSGLAEGEVAIATSREDRPLPAKMNWSGNGGALRKSSTLKKNQSGLVSIIVTLIIMLVMSLIVIGFAKLVRRDQRQTLDKQLNAQAFYAAEAGINDARQDIKNALSAGTPIPEKSTCAPNSSAPFNQSNIVDSARNISYTCLLVDPTPESLEYSNIDTSTSTVVPVTLKDTTDHITSITVSWQAKDGNTNFACPGSGVYPALPASSLWGCGIGIMRLDLVPTDGFKTRADYTNTTFSRFLYPLPGSPGVNSVGYVGSQGDFVPVQCSATAVPKYCTLTITGLSTTNLYIRLKSIYIASNATITCTTASGAACEMGGTQILVDSTGKANDVLRRIQVRVPDVRSGILPEGALDTSGNICKRYVIINNSSLSDPDSCGTN